MSAVESFRRLLEMMEERVRRQLAFFMLHPYRVARQVGERLNLQAVNEDDELRMPEIPAVPKAHGMPGVKALCRRGTTVLVGFHGGSPKAPFVAHYLDPVKQVGEPDTPQTPLQLELDAENEIRVGAGAVQGAARVSDTVTVLLPPATFVGTVGGSPATGMVIWSPGQTTGTISTGSAKVKIA